ncbi:MAG TPA: hypothetical protein VG738_24255 [Chitinophagaceae bacterium]|nr:hypothetical protein [Chitinophagaceae bacterium]
MKFFLFIIVSIVSVPGLYAQVQRTSIQTDFVLQARRQWFDTYLRDTIVKKAFTEPLDSNTEYDYETACLTVSQFMMQSPVVEQGFNTLFRQYNTLQYSTKAAFLESIYGLYPGVYENDIRILLSNETIPKLFAMQELYLFAADGSAKNRQTLLYMLNSRFPATRNNILLQLRDYINSHAIYIKTPLPPLNDLFAHQAELHQKTIYSLQRWNRDYPGLAILQNADGTFARDSTGKLLVFEQLARSASNLPYFITDGNTPQGIFSVTGLQTSRSHFLGPTPNIQMVMPFEDDQAYWGDEFDYTKDTLTNYLNQLPASWQQYTPLTEAYYAGRVGRSAVIAHGTTLNPAYFKGKPYYPISPTLGCLCAKEIWNTTTGTLLQSEQLNLINAFLATPGDIGYVMVINIDDKSAPVSRAEAERIVANYTNR